MKGIIAGLRDGTIDAIATDHAPHSAEEKARPLTRAPSGMVGLETSLAVTPDRPVSHRKDGADGDCPPDDGEPRLYPGAVEGTAGSGK